MIVKNGVFIFLFIVFHTALNSQSIYAVKTLWDEDFRQWEIVLDDGDLECELEMTWRLRNDPTEWNIRLDGQRGSLKQKWKENPNQWEMRFGSEIINISTIWTNDFNSYRISDGNNSIKIERANYLNDPLEWTISDERNGKLFWYNEFEFDIRDWTVIDEIEGDEISIAVKIAAVLITIIRTTYP